MLNDERDILMRKYEADRNPENYNKAVPLYEQAINENPESVIDLFSLAYIHELRGRQLFEEAAKLYKEASVAAREQKHEDYYKILVHLTRNYIKNGQSHKAIEFAKEQIKNEPDNLRLYCLLCNCYILADQLDDAEKTINAAMKINAHNEYVLFHAGEVAKLQEHYNQAFSFWDESFAINNDLVDNLYSKAFLLANLNKLEEAIFVWKEILDWLKKRGYNIEAESQENELVELEKRLKTKQL